jgi:small subunit ribosomal protein S2
MITKREFLFESGVQYGHRTSRLNPKMNAFIWGKKNGIHVINIALTEIQLTKAETFLEAIAESGKQILWVGTKKIVKNIVKKHAEKTKSPYLSERWIGGALTNYNEVRKAVKNLAQNKEIHEKSSSILTKKELNVIKKKIDRAEKSIGGIENLSWPLGAIIVADAKKDRIAINEAISVGIPVISIVDTNSSPDGITVCIPANDDLEKSVDGIFNYLSDAILRGAERYKPEIDTAILDEKIEIKEKSFKKNTSYIDKKNNLDIVDKKIEVKDSGKKDEIVNELKNVVDASEKLCSDNNDNIDKTKIAAASKAKSKVATIPSKNIASKSKSNIADKKEEAVSTKKSIKVIKKKTSSMTKSSSRTIAAKPSSPVKILKKAIKVKKKK